MAAFVTFVLYFFALISVFYIGYLIGRVQKLEYCNTIQAHSKTNSVSLQFVADTVESAATVRCPPDELPQITPAVSMNSINCDYDPVTPVYLHKRQGITQDLLFNYVNHAAQPTKGDVIITHHKQHLPYRGEGELTGEDSDPFTSCREVYLTRTGSRESPKPKCGKFCSFFSVDKNEISYTMLLSHVVA
jgi:hypothetical protein